MSLLPWYILRNVIGFIPLKYLVLWLEVILAQPHPSAMYRFWQSRHRGKGIFPPLWFFPAFRQGRAFPGIVEVVGFKRHRVGRDFAAIGDDLMGFMASGSHAYGSIACVTHVNTFSVAALSTTANSNIF
jgi:hypothetical protein